MSYPVISSDSKVQAHYEKCRALGTSHTLAEMLALAQPPMSNTDREFLQGRCNDNQFEKSPAQGDYYKSVAESQGADITGKVYLSGLAAYPGDPRAWVAGRGDVQRVCEERGWGCDGAVSMPVSRIAETGGPYRVADDLVEERAQALMDTQGLKSEEATEVARKQLSPNWN